MEPSNATFTLERIEGADVQVVWSERVNVTYVYGPRVVIDGYGTRWVFWRSRRCGLLPSEDEWRHIRPMVTVDDTHQF